MVNPARIDSQLTSLPGAKFTRIIPTNANLTRSYSNFEVFSRCFLFIYSGSYDRPSLTLCQTIGSPRQPGFGKPTKDAGSRVSSSPTRHQLVTAPSEADDTCRAYLAMTPGV